MELKEKRRIYRQEHPEKTREQNKRYRQQHPDIIKAIVKKSIKIRTGVVHQLKLNGCAICGYNKCDAALDFHHTNPEDKELNIGSSLRNGWSPIPQKLIDEINKCTLLCRNCHAEIENINNGD